MTASLLVGVLIASADTGGVPTGTHAHIRATFASPVVPRADGEPGMTQWLMVQIPFQPLPPALVPVRTAAVLAGHDGGSLTSLIAHTDSCGVLSTTGSSPPAVSAVSLAECVTNVVGSISRTNPEGQKTQVDDFLQIMVASPAVSSLARTPLSTTDRRAISRIMSRLGEDHEYVADTFFHMLLGSPVQSFFAGFPTPLKDSAQAQSRTARQSQWARTEAAPVPAPDKLAAAPKAAALTANTMRDALIFYGAIAALAAFFTRSICSYIVAWWCAASPAMHSSAARLFAHLPPRPCGWLSCAGRCMSSRP